MKKQRIAWKVLRKDKQSLVSACATGKAKVVYEKNKKAYPPDWLREKGYGLLVFKTRQQARNWKNSDFPFSAFLISINKVIIGPETKLKPICNSSYIKKGKLKKVPYNWPKGTKMVEWVKLLSS